MKTTLLSFLCTVIIAFGHDDPIVDALSSIPVQAALSDYVGIGNAVTQRNYCTEFQFDVNWVSHETNCTIILPGIYSLSPTNKVLLFAHRRPVSDAGFPQTLYRNILDHHKFGNHRLSSTASIMGCTPRATVPTNDIATIEWASNLVVAAQINLNTNLFYELIRDGFQQYPTNSRIYKDSKYALWESGKFLSKDFLQNVWNNDTNLTSETRDLMEWSYGVATLKVIRIPRTNDVPSASP